MMEERLWVLPVGLWRRTPGTAGKHSDLPTQVHNVILADLLIQISRTKKRFYKTINCITV